MIRLAIAMFFGAAGLAMAAMPPPLLSWADLTSRPRPTPDVQLRYGREPYQQVDLWVPKGTGRHKVVIMVHGGCWTTAIADRTLMDWIADDLRRDGIAVWNIDYRGVDRPGGGYPGTFADVAAAADMLRDAALRYHLDLGHVVAVGHSAGGHLALWLAARQRLPRASALWRPDPLPIAAVVSLGGLPDLEATAASPENGCGTEVVARLTGLPSPTRANVFADTSMPHLLPIGVPQHLVNGANDRIIPARFGPAYLDRARRAGDDATLDIVPATGHVELIAPESAAWAIAKRRIKAAVK